MSTPLLSEESVRRFIDEYGKCFVGLNADEIAFHYAAPTLGIRPGEARISATNQEIRDEFSQVVSLFRSQGFSHANRKIVDIRMHGQTVAECSVIWDIFRDSGDLLQRMEVTYLLRPVAESLKIAGVFLTQGQWEHIPT